MCVDVLQETRTLVTVFQWSTGNATWERKVCLKLHRALRCVCDEVGE